MVEPQKPIVKIGTVIPKLGEVLSIGKNQVEIRVNEQKQITCNFGEIERFISEIGFEMKAYSLAIQSA